MERLTREDWKPCDMIFMGMDTAAKISNRLAEYEDTGLTPEEIKVLKEFRDKNKGVEEYFETCVAKDKAIADRDYWKAEALKNCATLGEIKLLVGRTNE